MREADKLMISEFFYKSAILCEELEKSLKREQVLLEVCGLTSNQQLIDSALRNNQIALSTLNNWTTFAKNLAKKDGIRLKEAARKIVAVDRNILAIGQ